MTSPAQLQYLNAMGIPVWVSRELVIDDVLINDEAPAKATVQNTQPSNAVELNQSAAAVTNALDHILQDLEQHQEPKAKENPTANHSPSETIKKITESLAAESGVTQPLQRDIPNVLAKTTDYTVYAQGSTNAEWMVIGQNPVFIEHEQGQPYAAEEGILLENMIRAVGVLNPRKDAYLVNILQNSYDNSTDVKTAKAELNTILQECIKRISPKIIVIVGQLAAQNVLHSEEPLARLRHKPFTLAEMNIPVVVTYYPSYLLSKPSDKRKAWEDLKLAVSLIPEN